MAVQFKYLAEPGWQPENPDQDYLITWIKVELAEGVPEDKFKDAAATIAAESSTGTWTKVEAIPGESGIEGAEKLSAIAYDLDDKNKTFKVAYKKELFEYGNMSCILAGIVGNIAGMKMISGMRILDARFPEDIIKAYPGPAFGVEGMREILNWPEGPVLGTVPKPKIGRSAKQQEILSRRLWKVSGDHPYFTKDDENLTSVEAIENTFDERCKIVHQAQKEMEKETGVKKMYLCNTTHSEIKEMMRRADMIKEYGGYCMMIDVVTTGFTGLQSMRTGNPGLLMHGHRAMHGFIDRETGDGIHGEGKIQGFSISYLVLAKIYRMLGIDSLHTGCPKAKMEDYGESVRIAEAIQTEETPAYPEFGTLGQKWYGMKPCIPTASGGLHPGSLDTVINQMGGDIYCQMGGGVLGHPDGAEAGVQAALEALKIGKEGGSIEEYVKENPDSPLGHAADNWGFGPRVVY
jgi:ribulose-bisphosphate carboxylase large chain